MSPERLSKISLALAKSEGDDFKRVNDNNGACLIAGKSEQRFEKGKVWRSSQATPWAAASSGGKAPQAKLKVERSKVRKINAEAG